jgi:hypothetical protein
MLEQSDAGLTSPEVGTDESTRRVRWPNRFRSLRPALTIPQVLAWADAHHARTGRWPTVKTGAVAEETSEHWKAICEALTYGYRGLPGGSSLTRLLAEARGARNPKNLPRLSNRQILQWADAYFARHGVWPGPRSGEIPDSGGETWQCVQNALVAGTRGLWRRSSLARLLKEYSEARDIQNLPDLTIEQILKWADDYFAATGRWPARHSGGIRNSREVTWRRIDRALSRGTRGLPGGSSLARLLAQERRRIR